MLRCGVINCRYNKNRVCVKQDIGNVESDPWGREAVHLAMHCGDFEHLNEIQ